MMSPNGRSRVVSGRGSPVGIDFSYHETFRDETKLLHMIVR